MIKLLFICISLLTLNVFANEQNKTATIKDITSVYWLNPNHDGAIVYAKHNGFVQLKKFLSTTIQPENITTESEFDAQKAEQLLFMQQSHNTYLTVYISNKTLHLNGQTYKINLDSLKQLTQTNNYRINKGDLISNKLLNKAKKTFGLVAI